MSAYYKTCISLPITVQERERLLTYNNPKFQSEMENVSFENHYYDYEFPMDSRYTNQLEIKKWTFKMRRQFFPVRRVLMFSDAPSSVVLNSENSFDTRRVVFTWHQLNYVMIAIESRRDGSEYLTAEVCYDVMGKFVWKISFSNKPLYKSLDSFSERQTEAEDSLWKHFDTFINEPVQFFSLLKFNFYGFHSTTPRTKIYYNASKKPVAQRFNYVGAREVLVCTADGIEICGPNTTTKYKIENGSQPSILDDPQIFNIAFEVIRRPEYILITDALSYHYAGHKFQIPPLAARELFKKFFTVNIVDEKNNRFEVRKPIYWDAAEFIEKRSIMRNEMSCGYIQLTDDDQEMLVESDLMFVKSSRFL